MINSHEMFGDLIQQMHDLLTTLQNEGPSESRQDLTDDFMSALYELGLLLRQEPSLQTSAEFAHFIKEGESLLLGIVGSIRTYVNATESKFYSPWEYDEWTLVSKRRSAIEFLREFFRSSSFGEFLPFFDTDDIDRLFVSKEEKGGYLPVDVVPAGIPASHWWWWYPDAPPSAE